MSTLRFALRSLARSPGFVVIAVLALGLGLGLSTTMFAVLDAVVNPYMPYRDPDALFRVRWWYNYRDNRVPPGALYAALRDETSSFGAIVPYGGAQKQLETADDYRDISVATIPPSYFTVTGVTPRLGRGFVATDGDDVAILSDGLWRRLFGRRRNLAGAKITLSGRTYSVVGVMPRAAVIPEYAAIWLPLPATSAQQAFWQPIVRLRAGVAKDRADADLVHLGILMSARYAKPDSPIRFELTPVRERKEEIRDIHKAMVGAALSVLIIACVNLAHLMLARGLSKRRELAVRMALGASRGVVVRQMFAECIIITVAGAALGGVGAIWGADLLRNSMPPQVAWIGVVEPQLSWRVFALSALTAVASAVLFGLVPAIRVALRVNLDEPLKDGAGTTGRQRQRYSPLVVGEVALALVLMMGGGLLLRTLQQVRGIKFTFDERALLQASVGFRMHKDSTGSVMSDAILHAAEQVKGVRFVAYQDHRGTISGALTSEMVVGDSVHTITQRSYALVSWQYFKAYGLPVLKGRDFEPGDSAVAIINPIAAARLYPRDDAVGHMIKLGAPAADAPWVRIIGVVRSPAALGGVDNRVDGPQVWIVGPPHRTSFGSLLIRAETESPRIAVELRRRLHELPDVWFANVSSYAEERNSEVASRLFMAGVFVTMGTVALALAALGLYGVLAYAVNQRMREFAVRIALGAEPRQLFRMVMHDALVMLLGGIGAGAFVALVASKWLDAVLTAVLPSDVISLVGCEVVLISVGIAAALSPARRALRANPLDILRAV